MRQFKITPRLSSVSIWIVNFKCDVFQYILQSFEICITEKSCISLERTKLLKMIKEMLHFRLLCFFTIFLFHSLLYLVQATQRYSGCTQPRQPKILGIPLFPTQTSNIHSRFFAVFLTLGRSSQTFSRSQSYIYTIIKR